MTNADAKSNPTSQSHLSKAAKGTGLLVWVVIVGISIAQGAITSADTIYNYIYENSYSLQPGTAVRIASMVSIPWSLKPIWGAITDSFPIFGYRRKSYILLTCIIAFCGIHAYTFALPPVWLGILAIVGIHVGQSFQSVLGQAIIVENTQVNASGEAATAEEKEEATSKGVTVYISGRLVGRLSTNLIFAAVLTKTNYLTVLKILGFIPVAVVVLSFILKEKRIKKRSASSFLQDAESNRPRRSTINKGDNFKKFLKFIQHPLIFKSWMFIFFSSFQVSSDTAQFFYYTKFLGFSPSTIATVQSISVGSTILGIGCYYLFFKNISMRKFYTVTLLFVMGAYLFMIILYTRMNIKWGIPDFAMIVLDTFITAVVSELNSVPIWKLAAQLCPKGLEATVYAFMLAGANLAGIVSGQLLGIILDFLNITRTNFDNMWILALISAATPLISLYFVATVPFEEAIKTASEHNADEPEYEPAPEDKKASIEYLAPDNATTNGA